MLTFCLHLGCGDGGWGVGWGVGDGMGCGVGDGVGDGGIAGGVWGWGVGCGDGVWGVRMGCGVGDQACGVCTCVLNHCLGTHIIQLRVLSFVYSSASGLQHCM